jgi:hypothetical protein
MNEWSRVVGFVGEVWKWDRGVGSSEASEYWKCTETETGALYTTYQMEREADLSLQGRCVFICHSRVLYFVVLVHYYNLAAAAAGAGAGAGALAGNEYTNSNAQYISMLICLYNFFFIFGAFICDVM